MSLILDLFLVAAALAASPDAINTQPIDALTAYKRGDLSKACALFREITRAKPSNGAAWADLGLCLHKSGEPGAVEASCKAVSLGDEHTKQSARFNLGKWGGQCDPSGERRASLPQNMLVNGTQLVRSNFRDGRIELINLSSHAVERSIMLADAPPQTGSRRTPGDLAVAGGKLFVVHDFTPEVNVFDLNTFEPAGVIKLPDAIGGTLCASPDGQRLVYASNGSRRFLVINPRTLRAKSVSYPPSATGALACLVSPDGKRLFIATARPRATLLTYDLDAQKPVAASIALSSESPAIGAALVAAADGKKLYVGMFQSNDGILEVDLEQNQVTQRMHLASREGPFSWADPIALGLVDDRLVAVLRNNAELMVIDRTSMTALSTTPLEGDGQGNNGLVFWADQVIADNDGLTWFTLGQLRGL